jgi:DNA-binding CsgD family transcriptional regulator
LEGDDDRALRDLTRAVREEADRLTHYLSFTPGPHLLLAALAGAAGWPEYWELSSSGLAQARWNRQFIALTAAVLSGRDGQPEAAARAVHDFEIASEPYPLARHVGLRLAGRAAVEDGWGEPAVWLRTAEAYFHRIGARPGAAACRALLRRAGAPVLQRRRGSDAIPSDLRQLGVTVREYEVLQQVAHGLTNHEIGRRLFLSPRTVEKHVARLLTKTGQLDRVRLASYAARTGTGPELG